MRDSAYMKLMPEIAWRSAADPGVRVDPRLLRLLREIRDRSTLRAAVVPLGMSYRGAWDLLATQARLLGAPLVKMERGRGARLAPLAEKLVAADDAARRHLESGDTLTLNITAGESAATGKLRVAASHDLLLAEFGTPFLDLVFRGSLDSLRDYARGEVDLAGFHLSPDPEAAASYQEL